MANLKALDMVFQETSKAHKQALHFAGMLWAIAGTSKTEGQLPVAATHQ